MRLQQIHGSESSQGANSIPAGDSYSKHLHVCTHQHVSNKIISDPAASHAHYSNKTSLAVSASVPSQEIKTVPPLNTWTPSPLHSPLLTLHFKIHGLGVLPDGVAGCTYIFSGICVLNVFESQGWHPGMATYYDAPIQGLARKEKRIRGWALSLWLQTKGMGTSASLPLTSPLMLMSSEVITWGQVKSWA